MSLPTALAANLSLAVALLSGLAYVMTRPARLRRHDSPTNTTQIDYLPIYSEVARRRLDFPALRTAPHTRSRREAA